MIKVDFKGLVPQSLIALMGGGAFLQQVLDDVASSARAKWIRLAQTELGSSKRDYITGIQEIEGEGAQRTISLVGWLANSVERGMPVTDMRTTMLGPGKGKVSKDGHRYRSIPMRHGTPGSRGQAGAPMGSRMGPQGGASFGYAAEGVMSRGQAAQLGKRLYSLAKRLRPGQKLSAGHAPKLAAWHKTDIFSGMQRQSAKRSGPRREGSKRGLGSHTQYMTFRTISEANPDGWIHPGIQGRQLAPQVQAHIRKIIPATISAAVKAALGGI